MNNKVITTQGNVQFQFPDGKIVNVHPNHIYTVFNEDTVSFILVGLPKTSGLSTMTSKAEDLELNGTVYSFAELPNAISEAFAIAGAQARCEIVDELPETGYTNTIYLVPQPAPQTGFDEYVYILDQGWELIGDTSIEMDNYVLKTVFSGYTADTAVVLEGLRTDVDTTSGNVITETERALLAESGLSDAISAETSAREAADGVISGAVTAEISAAVSGKADSSDVYLKSETSGATELSTAFNLKANVSDLNAYFDDAKYELSGSTHVINFYNGDTVKATIDCSDFIIDGMVDNVYIENGYLVIDFNTESGKQDIQIPLTDIFNPNNYYTKSETSGATELSTEFATKLNTADFNTYSGSVDTRLAEDEEVASRALNALNEIVSGKVSTSDFEIYSGAVETALSGKANSSDVYLKSETSGATEIATALSAKLDATAYTPTDLSNYYTKSETSGATEISTALSNKLDATAYTPTDLSNYYTKSETSGATEISTALSGKQDTLSAGTNITIVDNVISAEGGGKAIVAGRGITVTSGETADTVSFNLPIYSGTGEGSIFGGYSGNTASGKYSIALGGRYEGRSDYNYCTATNKGSVSFGGQATGQGAFTCGESTKASGRNAAAIACYIGEASGVESFITGRKNEAKGFTTFVSGFQNIGENDYEFVAGHLAKSNKASTTFGDSGNTLFSVGNGTSTSARHNAFEIRQNGDIYLSSGGTDIKLQDHLGGSSYTAGDGIDITSDVISVTGKVSTSDFNTYSGSVDTELSGKASQSDLNTLSGQVTANTTAIASKVDTSAVTSSITSGSADVVTSGGVYEQFGGMKIVKLTESEYTALVTKDSNVLYVVIPDPTNP